MDDREVLQMLEKYEKKELEIARDYNIKKEELEKEYKKRQIDNKFELLNFLSQKQEETKKKYETISQIRNILFGYDENEGMKELNNMAKETKATFENDNNNQDIQLRERTENNKMKKINPSEAKKETDLLKGIIIKLYASFDILILLILSSININYELCRI